MVNDIKWKPNSWKLYTCLQQPKYEDNWKVVSTFEELSFYPGLVSLGEINTLKKELSCAERGEKFIIQGGDCVERFIDCNETSILNKLRILLQMSMIFSYTLKRPVVRIGRIAGQYFKPRSSDVEKIDNENIPVYRGDGINGIMPKERKPNPERLLSSYFHSAASLNFIRATISGGFADLHHPMNWNLYSIEKTPLWKEYKEIIDNICNSIDFMELLSKAPMENLGTINLYTSHEGLHLGYETRLLRKEKGCYYCSSTHMPWIGKRTLFEGSGHIEFFRGVANPIGLKIGPDIDPDTVIKTCRIFNPDNSSGKICLITRLGSEKSEDILYSFISAVKRAGLNVLWLCDPMHGNIKTSKEGLKTRSFDDIVLEIKNTQQIHRKSGSILGGLHFELTGEDVTECTGGALGITETELFKDYRSYCDPRLNYSQTMELAFKTSWIINNKV